MHNPRASDISKWQRHAFNMLANSFLHVLAGNFSNILASACSHTLENNLTL